MPSIAKKAAGNTTLATALIGGLLACSGGVLVPIEPRPDAAARSNAYRMLPAGRGSGALSAASSCDDLATTLREREAQRMEQLIEQNLAYALDMLERPGESCYDPSDDGCGFAGWFCASADAAPAASDRDMEAAPAEGAGEYTTTNNQVAGVDEADFIKNDSRYIYMVAGDRLLVIEAWPAAETHVVASLPVEGTPKRLFVYQSRLVVFSDLGDEQSCEYDPYYGPVTSGRNLQITVYDIGDVSAPKLERQTTVSGEYVAARLIGDTVHAVVSFSHFASLPFRTWPDDIPENLCESDRSAEKVRAAFRRLADANRSLVAKASLDDFLPSVRDRDLAGDQIVAENDKLFFACERFLVPNNAFSQGYLSVLSFPVGDDHKLGATTIVGRFGEVYAAPESLYVAVKEYTSSDDFVPYDAYATSERTLVHKFALAPSGEPAVYRGTGSVPGHILNQFSMDEHDGFLRIATTEGWMVSNDLFVLSDTGSVDSGLVVSGAVTGIAPNEDIRSVRFDGDRGFVVTFKKTDPLFTFDLSDPYAPRILGELQIPGFSTYMHFMNPTHLLTIGFDAQDEGDFAWFQGILLQIFDVTDMQSPNLLFREVVGTRGTNSDATSDHLAFTYLASRGLLALPMTVCADSSGGSNYGSQMTFSGLLVYDVSLTDGFALVGGVSHWDSSAAGTTSCNTWWQDPSSQVKRSIFMDDVVYSVSSGTLKVNALSALDDDLVSLPIPGLESQFETAYCGLSW